MVICHLHKEDPKWKTFEGIRVAEIQTTGKPENDVLQEWTGIESEDSPAIWTTKPRSVEELVANGHRQRRPRILRNPVEDGRIRTTFKDERREGNLLQKEVVERMFFVATKDCDPYKLLYSVGST